ncbi:glycosyltransferase [Nitratireductor thuwali]|uniref:Glycosyltransferase EpsE n=1 Tax=Nitratireductor thuwali TaxID=2267699 RepID=A0ABY5MJS6_9HYPH|nr:Putative glycosyltransferase EpsE [Nitratireductor thuwali]
MTSEPKIAVLMATFNGAPFLEEQLHSIASQEITGVDVWASDDGSTDNTLEILQCWGARWNKGVFRIKLGPKEGYVENFRRLIITASVGDAYVAFSDQDDIWDFDKLSHAVWQLGAVGPRAPAMYCGRTRLVTKDGYERGMSPCSLDNQGSGTQSSKVWQEETRLC